MQTLFLLLMVGAIPEPTSDQQLGLLFLGYVLVTIVFSGWSTASSSARCATV